jgi:hypothetical protein
MTIGVEGGQPEKIKLIFIILYLFWVTTYCLCLDGANNNQNTMKKFLNRRTFVILCGIVILVWISWHFVIVWLTDGKTIELGNWGDAYNILTTLFTGLAFAGLVFTILLQTTQLNDSEKDQATQRFENILFQMLNSLNQIIDSIQFGSGQGRDAFKNMYIDLDYNYIRADRSAFKIPLDEDTEKAIIERYASFYDVNQANLGHYYRTLYWVFQFINRSNMTDKQFYSKLVRAQLSSEQLLLLFYNGFLDGAQDFKPLIENYTLFKHLRVDRLPPDLFLEDGAPLKTFYKPNAYKKQDIEPSKTSVILEL